jgi:hypothetical protein
MTGRDFACPTGVWELEPIPSTAKKLGLLFLAILIACLLALI